MKFETKGIYTKKGVTEKFVKLIDASNEKMAKEKIFAELGSKQNIKRTRIVINEIKTVK